MISGSIRIASNFRGLVVIDPRAENDDNSIVIQAVMDRRCLLLRLLIVAVMDRRYLLLRLLLVLLLIYCCCC